MKRIIKIVGGIAFAGLFAAPPLADAEDAVAQGQYLTKAADCVSCHTAEGGKPFAGGLPFKTPMGTIYAPNITPDKATGIGTWTDADFLRALHKGIGQQGEHLYPAFPYTSFAALTETDVASIKAYLFSQPAVRRENTPNEMAFPYNMRFLMMAWNLINFHPQTIDPKAERGKYLADALGHCADCHSPRGLTMGVKDESYLAGGVVDGWTAFNITSDVDHGIGSWSADEIKTYLKTGTSDKAQAAGPMADVITNSTSRMTDADLTALANYLKEVPAKSKGGDGRFTQGGPVETDIMTRYRASLGSNAPEGQVLFSAACTTCHGMAGEGVEDGAMPSLYHNSSTGAVTPDNLALVILDGVQRGSEFGDASMPGFRDEFSDDQVAALVNYVRKTFGTDANAITPAHVKDLRNGVQPPAMINTLMKWGGIVAGFIVLLLIIGVIVLGVRHKRSSSY